MKYRGSEASGAFIKIYQCIPGQVALRTAEEQAYDGLEQYGSTGKDRNQFLCPTATGCGECAVCHASLTVHVAVQDARRMKISNRRPEYHPGEPGYDSRFAGKYVEVYRGKPVVTSVEFPGDLTQRCTGR